MDNVLWAAASGLLAWIARVKMKAGIQVRGARAIFWLCILSIIFIFVYEQAAYVFNIAAIVLAFILGKAERKYLAKLEEEKKSKTNNSTNSSEPPS